MPTLLLMRHAKSDWSDVGCPDHDRPLNKRGRRDAPRMGRRLKEQGIVPARIVTSSAQRALQTTERIVEGLETELPVDILDDLYHATIERWLTVLANLPDADTCILCVGHNPGLEGLVEQIGGSPERMPTAAIALLTVGAAGWRTFGEDSPQAKLQCVWRPKELEDAQCDS